MILVFGGTTEGKKTVEVLDFIDEPYFYSTKNKVEFEGKGKTVFGVMEPNEMVSFCKKEKIRLLVDAAHPFAVRLHENIFAAAQQLEIPVLRYERTYQALKEHEKLRFFDSYEALVEEVLASEYQNILALTGVLTIEKMTPLWQNKNCYFRILDTDLSRKTAAATNIDSKFISPINPSGSVSGLIELARKVKAELLLSKESGESGFVQEKVDAAKQLNIPLWIVKRPALPLFDFTVHNQKELLQQIYQLRKSILKMGGTLRPGFTTGSCVTAAAKASFIALQENEFPRSVTIKLPDGEESSFLIFSELLSEKKASCVVIKNGGDDPDVTHGKEIGCELELTNDPEIRFVQGKGVGKVTLPGLSLPIGEPAINPVPRQMIINTLEDLKVYYETENGFVVKPFVPEGKELTKQTFNSRVGVLGGISIIGTTGKVKPFSNEAFLATIGYQLSVAKESGCDEIVLTSGKRSENILKPQYTHLPDTAFIHFGNLIGDTLQLTTICQFSVVTLGLMFGKAIKLAEGHLNTHSRESAFNPKFAVEIARKCGYDESIILKIEEVTLANAISDFIPISKDEPFYQEVVERSSEVLLSKLEPGQHLDFYLLNEGRIIIFKSN